MLLDICQKSNNKYLSILETDIKMYLLKCIYFQYGYDTYISTIGFKRINRETVAFGNIFVYRGLGELYYGELASMPHGS